MFACVGQESPPAFRGQSFRGFRFAARTEKSRAVMDSDDAMHPPPILFDCRTREFEPTRRSFDFIEVIALSVRCNDAEYRVSLRICNAKATLRMRLCTPRRSHLHRAKFIP